MSKKLQKLLPVFKLLLLSVFFAAVILSMGCESEPAQEQPSPDPEPPQQHEEMVEEEREDIEDINDIDGIEDITEDVILDEDGPLGLEPGQAARNARLTLYSEDGSTRLEVRSEEAVRRERAAEISLYPVLVDSFPGKNGEFNSEPAYELRGEEGIYLEDDQILTIKGEARLESKELIFLSADISWQLESSLIFSREKTTIKGKGFSAYGQSFEAEADLSKFNLKGNSGERARIVREVSTDKKGSIEDEDSAEEDSVEENSVEENSVEE